jgi:ribose/xylose/arabinose/galactoside ABC-type transport system permease subunit
MKQLIKSLGFKALFTSIMILTYQFSQAQESPKVEVNNTDVGTWIGQNWLWVVGIIALLIIILIASGGKRTSKTTTIRRDDGRITTVTTEKVD